MSSEVVTKQIKMNNVRLLRVSLTKPYVGRDAKIDPATGKADGKFHIDAVFPPTHPQFPELQALIRNVATAKWKEQTQQTLDMIKGNNQRFPLQRGDQYRPGKPDYAGQLFHSAGAPLAHTKHKQQREKDRQDRKREKSKTKANKQS